MNKWTKMYRSNKGWEVRHYGRGQWNVYDAEGQLWGNWERDEGGTKQYVPFTTKEEALATLEHYESKGFVDL